MALDSDLSDFAYNLAIQTSQSFSFFQEEQPTNNNKQPDLYLNTPTQL